ncbi:hypothetical protein CXG81DRAFT_10852 [Caulochytrium protostelioides]|uniref:P-loop containing nucleoside triphosphate hydrolase protein n=1 Tax=Caulochytrium protostelioides TaxID=1555241 RepID=A0A4P9XAL1_9FUNG|nr:hypothetical protein CXG81DRAFT_10852 [Caulochytrium protostelioides]|eukprot:RKP02372.1 hypothetical protein CXG81DRAFT_10852 [Caulochytrium protostelioides]
MSWLASASGVLFVLEGACVLTSLTLELIDKPRAYYYQQVEPDDGSAALPAPVLRGTGDPRDAEAHDRRSDSVRAPEPNREESANFFSRITFHWMSALMRLGASKTLTLADLWPLKPADRAQYNGERLARHWRQTVQNGRPSLIWACAKAFGPTLGYAVMLKLVQDMCAFTQPLLLRFMLQFAASWGAPEIPHEPLQKGVLIALAMLSVALIQTLFLHQYFQCTTVCGLRVRSALTTLIYTKSLVLSPDARQSSTTGQIVNLMSVDTTRLMDLCTYLLIVVSGPFQIALAMYFLYQTLGVSTLAGVAVMILSQPLNALMANVTKKINISQMGFKDTRTKLIDEFLGGIKAIKLYAWERPLLRNIMQVREQELDNIRRLGILRAFTSLSWSCTPFLVTVFTFLTFVMIEDPGELTSDKIFVSVSLFSLIRFPLAVLPDVISSIVEATVSFQRLQTYLLAEELDTRAVERLPEIVDTADRVGANGKLAVLQVTSADFAWSHDRRLPILRNVTFHVDQGELFCIVGKTGAGKSSLLSALLGEMYKLRGHVSMMGKLAYVPQSAWIMNMSLRDNILFNLPYERSFYEKVVDACGLRADLAALPDGDLTEIGEKGINLSGGQKQRIAVARAVYSRADVYFFDDPLSAVDVHVGRHIFDRVLHPRTGLLKRATRVLVTHGLQYVADTDRVMVLDNGCVVECDTYAGLMALPSGHLKTLITEHGHHQTDSESDTAAGEDEGDDHVAAAEGADSLEALACSPPTHHGDGTARPPRRRRRSSAVNSVLSAGTGADGDDDAPPAPARRPEQLVAEESAATGAVSWDVYWAYMRACKPRNVVLFLVTCFLVQAASLSQNIYLSWWADANDRRSHPSDAFGHAHGNDYASLRRVGIYGALGFLMAAFNSISVLTIYVTCCIHAARYTHNSMLKNVSRLPQSFFDTTPLGRVLNRFTRDQYTIDETLPRCFSSFCNTCFQVATVVVINCYNTPFFLFAVIPLAYVYLRIQKYYLSSSRELKRLDATTRSPLYAHFQETLGGTSSIRAYGQQSRFVRTNQARMDTNSKAYFPSLSSNRWLAVRLELIGAAMVFGSSIFVVVTILMYGTVSAAIVGLTLTYSLNVTQNLNWVVRQSCEIETNIVSVERIKEYAELPTEAAYTRDDDPACLPLDDQWPHAGAITFEHFGVRYRDHLPLAVRDVDLTIQPHEKVGIVGRTGSGKSTLTLALFRLLEAATGRIVIDGVPTAQLALADLRSRLSIIPQDPFLFAGTLRDNLDPEGKQTDAAMWAALEEAQLKDYVASLPEGLDVPIVQGGENFSVGQRQLLAMARALLRRNRILVLDEATASVDVVSDRRIQATIRCAFRDSTLICIAHRLLSIVDYDRVIVMDQGRVLEFGRPSVLLQQPDSAFRQMCVQTGDYDGMLAMALQADKAREAEARAAQ